MDSTSLCTKVVKSLFTTQRNGFSFNNNSRKKLNNQARCGTNVFKSSLYFQRNLEMQIYKDQMGSMFTIQSSFYGSVNFD